ncbi:MAG: hypothetical protein GF317_04375 [Candidatus Lokiarchaeota archaeon]|nr:hypothetical protein [Candidatus Lokiarchaeota archaeon]MBD3199125.1 hypothetical protein [Candidatus Lokiarchaeota archaeon]
MEEKVFAQVQSPAKDHHLRQGEGFSLSEIQESDHSISNLKDLGINIDYNRRSRYDFNIEKLKELEIPEKKTTPREPFVKKQKKRTPFIPREAKPEKKKEEQLEEELVKTPKKKKPTKEKQKPDKISKKEQKEIPLTKLSRLGPKTEEKFSELGVTSVQKLIGEDPSELGTLIDGCSEKSVKKWIDEGKEMLNE